MKRKLHDMDNRRDKINFRNIREYLRKSIIFCEKYINFEDV